MYRIRSARFAPTISKLLLLQLLSWQSTWPLRSLPAVAQETAAPPPLERLVAHAPRSVTGCTAENAELVERWAVRVERAAAESDRWDPQRYQDVIRVVRGALERKALVDAALREALDLRGRLGELPAGEDRVERLRNYLRSTSTLIDLSGRLRYLLRDTIDAAAYDLDADLESFDRLLELLAEHESSIGATVMSYVLFDPEPGTGLRPYPLETKVRALKLIEASRSMDLLDDLAAFVRGGKHADLTVKGAQLIRRIGLPQDARPGQDPTLPEPVITAGQLHELLSDPKRFAPGSLSESGSEVRRELLTWLEERMRHGIRQDAIQVGDFRLRPGDWLLMRNPSPYNLFTNLSPGLFTHVGVVAAEQGEDGVRRFVIVDLPERGSHVPATNVDVYLRRTLHYFFVRHPDPEVAARMGKVAREVIGSETQFDLLFRTDRVEALRGQPLKGRRIHTYCAGFLLMCAQETSAPRDDFFPVAESPAGGFCLENLARLGMSIGENFVSPSGALFSSRLELVGRREPMYEPGREIEETVYDHFARCMIEKKLTPAPDALQALRERLARLSKSAPWLARALARANNVSEHMDLEAAAKAAAVIETLDEVARGNSAEFRSARDALLAGPVDALRAAGRSDRDIETIERLRKRHSDLYALWLKQELTPRKMRVALVRFYGDRGKTQLDERFFREPAE